jgi:hypothetical protein
MDATAITAALGSVKVILEMTKNASEEVGPVSFELLADFRLSTPSHLPTHHVDQRAQLLA